ncbi:hypothetical protein ACFL5L_01405 [candidate division KSB1 bacterium]
MDRLISGRNVRQLKVSSREVVSMMSPTDTATPGSGSKLSLSRTWPRIDPGRSSAPSSGSVGGMNPCSVPHAHDKTKIDTNRKIHDNLIILLLHILITTLPIIDY